MRHTTLKCVIIFFLPVVMVTIGMAQHDSTLVGKTLSTDFSKRTPGTSNFLNHSESQKKLIIKGNVTFTSYSIQPTFLETEISDLEAQECTGILKRDTAALRKLWARDFTLDEPQNQVVNGQNPLPYYASLSRMVEKFTSMDHVVYTSGYEYYQPVKPGKKLEDPIKRNYFHTWTNKNGIWKLTTKTHD